MGSKPAVQSQPSIISTDNSWRPIVTPFGQPPAQQTKRRRTATTPKQLEMTADSILNDRLG